MKRFYFYLVLTLLFLVFSITILNAEGAKNMTSGKSTTTANPQVLLETSLGTIQLELFANKAPITVKNFLHYADTGFYANTIFHRVIPGFMIQGGGFIKGMNQKQTEAPIKNEAGNGLSNDRGTIAMARTPMVDSATSQFFINLTNNSFLNHRDDSPNGFGYCVFGRVVKGMEVVDKIAGVSTNTVGPYEAVPVQDVVIKSVKRVK